MRTAIRRSLNAVLISAITTANLLAQDVPLDDRFTYQGELRQSGAVVDGTADFQLSIFDQPAGGNQIGATHSATNVTVSRGVFEVQIPFAPNTFDGNKRHLQIAVRSPAGSGTYTTLNPRVELLPTPNAHHARTASNASAVGGANLSQLVQKGEANAVTAVELATNSVGSSEISSSAVGASEIATNAVGASEIAAGAVGSSEIAPNAVGSSEIIDNSIGASDIGPDAVTTSEIKDGSITIADLAPGTISTNASTLDGVDSSQFLRSDTSDSFGGSTLTIGGSSVLNVDGTLQLDGPVNLLTGKVINVTGGTNTALTIDGANLQLQLGGSSADTTTVSGDLNVNDVLDAGNTTPALPYHRIGSLVSSIPASWSTYNVNDENDLFVSENLDVGNWLWSGTYMNRGNFIGFIGDDDLLETSIYWSTLSDPDRLVLASDTQIVSDLFLEGLNSVDADSNVYFEDNSDDEANYIRWDDVYTQSTSCTSSFDSAFVWNIQDNTESGWLFKNGSDTELAIDEIGNLFADGTLTTSSGCDLAEMFLSSENLEAGTLVSADLRAPEAVLASRRSYDSALLGVVSTRPGLMLNGPTADAEIIASEMDAVSDMLRSVPGDEALIARRNELEATLESWTRGDVPVALAGRVPVKVVGVIQAGEPLTSSATPGHAMALKRFGPSIGIALESKRDEGPGTVLVMIQPGARTPFESPNGDEATRTDLTRSNDIDQRLLALEARMAIGDRGANGRDGRDATGQDGRSGIDGDRSDSNGTDDRTDSNNLPIVRLQKEVWGDVDGDGKDDVLVMNPVGNARLFKNLGDGAFRDITAASALEELSNIRIARMEDYDGDRHADLLLVDSDGKATLHQSLGNGAFTDMTMRFGIDFGQPIVDAKWLDNDHDGKLDLRVELADGALVLHHNLGGGAFKAMELAAGNPNSGPKGSSDLSALQAENAAIRAELAELKALVNALANGGDR